jgi:hypothetical protein
MAEHREQVKKLLYEYAIDPSCLSSWDRVKYFSEKLGFHHGRLIGSVPKKNKWRRDVYNACSGCADVDKLRITEKLSALNEAFVEAGRINDGNEGWLDSAEREHKKNPFRAIIADSNPKAFPEVLLAADITDETPLWNLERGCLVERKAEVLAQCVSLALAASKKILFIDPYFDPSKLEFRRTLEHFVREAKQANQAVEVEYHCDDHLGKLTFDSECRRLLPSILPEGQTVRFIRWKRRSRGTKLHALTY